MERGTKMSEQVLAVFPHPDDEAFGVSGTISLHTKKGIPVSYACLTLGEMGRNMGNPPFANRETLPLIRKEELEKACKAIGINDLRLLGYRDKTVEFEDQEKIIAQLTEIIEELKPTLIITFYPGYSVHPDHDATGAAVIESVKRLPEKRRPVVHCVAFSKNCEEFIGEPDVINDVSSVVNQKIAAMQAHRSQTAWMVNELEEKYRANDPDTIRWVTNERFWTYKF